MKTYIKTMLVLVLFPIFNVTAQVGIPTNNPNKDAVLDLNNTDGTSAKGLLLPKVGLTTTDNPAPSIAHIAGMHVYNTATAGTGSTQVIPGEYYNDGSKWISIPSAGWGLQGNSNTTTSNFLGTTDLADLPLRTNNTEQMRISSGGQILVGATTAPTGGTTAKMVLNNTTPGALQIKDGTEGNNYILTSDSKGVATWQQQTIDVYYMQTPGSGVNIPSSPMYTWYYANSSISLPPGKWLVTVTMLLTKSWTTGVWTGNTESWWINSSFSDSSTVLNITPDVVGGGYISGLLPPSSIYNIMSGNIIINNTSGANKTYYYMGLLGAASNPTGQLMGFGGGWGENSISWQQIK